MYKLEPCPKCGENGNPKAKMHDGALFSVECESCGLSTDLFLFHEEAAHSWNAMSIFADVIGTVAEAVNAMKLIADKTIKSYASLTEFLIAIGVDKKQLLKHERRVEHHRRLSERNRLNPKKKPKRR